MKRVAGKRAFVGLLAAGAVSTVVSLVGPSASAGTCAPPKTEGPAIAGPVYGEGSTDAGSGYVGVAGDQGYIEVAGSDSGNVAVYGASSDGSAEGYLGVNGTSTTPSYCTSPSAW